MSCSTWPFNPFFAMFAAAPSAYANQFQAFVLRNIINTKAMQTTPKFVKQTLACYWGLATVKYSMCVWIFSSFLLISHHTVRISSLSIIATSADPTTKNLALEIACFNTCLLDSKIQWMNSFPAGYRNTQFIDSSITGCLCLSIKYRKYIQVSYHPNVHFQ